MSTPQEEARAVAQVRQFLYDLLNPRETPRVPKYIRQKAHRLSKHYPILPTLEQANKCKTMLSHKLSTLLSEE